MDVPISVVRSITAMDKGVGYAENHDDCASRFVQYGPECQIRPSCCKIKSAPSLHGIISYRFGRHRSTQRLDRNFGMVCIIRAPIQPSRPPHASACATSIGTRSEQQSSYALTGVVNVPATTSSTALMPAVTVAEQYNPIAGVRAKTFGETFSMTTESAHFAGGRSSTVLIARLIGSSARGRYLPMKEMVVSPC